MPRIRLAVTAPLSFAGWTTFGALGVAPREGAPTTRVYALVTRDEIELTTLPPGIDGRTRSLIGRGLCYVHENSENLTMTSFGPTHWRDNPAP